MLYDNMKTYNHLYEQIYSFENLLLAARQAQKRKRSKLDVARFNFHLEGELLNIQAELLNQTYRPGEYCEFYIHEPKKRLISAAPYRDRVVHHAICNIIEPIFDKTFIYDSYACRQGKGTHKAVERFTRFCRKNEYVLKCDIKKYFPSVDHEILFDLICRKIRDERTLLLIKLIIDKSNEQEWILHYFWGDDLLTALERRKGIPIGNLTSQFFANIYLNGFDHFVKETIGCRYYIRYCDDFVVLSDDKQWLHEVKSQMAEYLATLRLKLHPKKCTVFPIRCGTDFLGYRIFPTHRLLRKENIKRARRRLKWLEAEYNTGAISLDKVKQSIQSWIAHASWADTYGLRKQMLKDIAFQRKNTINRDLMD